MLNSEIIFSNIHVNFNRKAQIKKDLKLNYFLTLQFAVFALAAVANCEPPSGYNYNRPQSFGSGVSAGGSSFGNGGGGGFSSGGNYEQEAIGGQTYEGQQVDAQLLEKIKQILLNEESKAGAGAGAGGFGQPSSQYGAPQPQYGPPPQAAARVVGIILENTQPAIQVAQYRAQSTEAVSGGYPASTGGVAPSSNYAAPPSNSYGAPSRPSSNYGAPF